MTNRLTPDLVELATVLRLLVRWTQGEENRALERSLRWRRMDQENLEKSSSTPHPPAGEGRLEASALHSPGARALDFFARRFGVFWKAMPPEPQRPNHPLLMLLDKARFRQLTVEVDGWKKWGVPEAPSSPAGEPLPTHPPNLLKRQSLRGQARLCLRRVPPPILN